MRRVSLLLMLALATAAPRAGAQEPTVIYVVRHAERLDQSRDAVLSEAGRARAQALAAALADARVTAIVTTQFQRTRLTAGPLAAALNLTPVVVEAGGRDTPAHVRAVADSARRFAGRTVLVVGHSNTVPGIVAALGAPQPAALCDNEHAWLFIVTIRPGGETSLVRARYGAADGPDPADCRR